MSELHISKILSYLDEANLQYVYQGDMNININTYAPISNLKEKSVSWIKKIDDFSFNDINQFQNILIISNKPKVMRLPPNFNFIICDNPKEIFFSILDKFWKSVDYTPSIAVDSIVDTNRIGSGVYIGHHTFIGKNVNIGNDVIIKNNVSIEGAVNIGSRTIIHSGVVIGTDGYGYYQDEHGLNKKVPHYGGVIIGNDVEIGANVCIDRGTLDNTIIGDNVKIDNLCHIAHNVIIKDNSCVIALSMLGGSSVLEENAYIAPGALVMNQLHVGKDALVGMGAVVTKNVDDNTVVAGVPAKPLRQNKVL